MRDDQQAEHDSEFILCCCLCLLGIVAALLII